MKADVAALQKEVSFLREQNNIGRELRSSSGRGELAKRSIPSSSDSSLLIPPFGKDNLNVQVFLLVGNPLIG